VRRTAEGLDDPGVRPAARRHAVPRAAGPAAGLGALVLIAFMASLAIPGTFRLGPVNLTVYRLVLIAACIPLGLRWIRGGAGPVSAVDLIYLANCLWISIALVMVHGLSRIIYVGTNFIELFGAYLVGRVLVRDAATHRTFVRCMAGLLLLFAPFALIEALTGQRLFDQVFGTFMSVQDRSADAPRLGFIRAAVAFSHPIHFGLFGSVVFANLYFLLWRRREIVRTGAAAFVAVTTMLSISSSALFSLVLQVAMIVWERGLGFLRNRWAIGLAIGAGFLLVLLASVQGGLFTYIVENLIFSPGAGEHRMEIYQYGTREVLRHPLFGVGLNDWARPFWREHPTIDSFWMMTAIRSGIPAVTLLVLAVLLGMLQIGSARGLDEDGRQYRTGYMIALAGLVLVLSTVHVWGPAVVFVMCYLGAGSWFYTSDHRPARPGPARMRREREAARRGGAAAGDGDDGHPGGQPGGRPGNRRGNRERIVRSGPVGYERGPGRRHGSKAVGGAGRGPRGAVGPEAGPGLRKRV
jgi:hypothetical protein